MHIADVFAIAGVTLAAYLIGSFPSAYLAARILRGIDIRAVGSGNPGAVNVVRHVGLGAGVGVLIADAFKGALVVLIVRASGLGEGALFAGAVAALLGHNWPIFLGFRGGKGVAVIFGLSLALLPLWTLAALGAALGLGLATRNVVFGIAAGMVTVNALTVATGQSAVCVALCLTLSAVVIATHFALTYRDVLRAVRREGVWGLFGPE